MRAIGLVACLGLFGCMGSEVGGDIGSTEQQLGDPACQSKVETVYWDGKTIPKGDTDKSILLIFDIEGNDSQVLAAGVDVSTERVYYRALVNRKELQLFMAVAVMNRMDLAGSGRLPPVGPPGGPIWDRVNDPTILERGVAIYKARDINFEQCPLQK